MDADVACADLGLTSDAGRCDVDLITAASSPGRHATRRVQVVIVVAVRLYREGLTHALGQSGSLDVLGAVSSVELATNLVSWASVDVVLLSTPVDQADREIRSLRRVAPGAKIVALAVPAGGNEAVRWAEAGAHGFITCDASLDELIVVVQSATRDEFPCSPRVAAALISHLGRRASAGAEPAMRDLTRRETQVADLLDVGLSNKEIARQLHIGLPTVKNHVHNILDKLQVQRRGEAVARRRAPT
jgi:two-component system nitrate/nitrite response regulator NarL